jgi:hypothetical protein
LAFIQPGLRTGFDTNTPIETPTAGTSATPSQVIEAVNALRISQDRPLGVHPVLMQVGQMEAEGIAGGMGGHWRPNSLTLGQWLISLGYPLSGDLSLDGYRSENWGFAQSAEEVAMWLVTIYIPTPCSHDRSDIGVGIAYSAETKPMLSWSRPPCKRSGQQQSEALIWGIPQRKSPRYVDPGGEGWCSSAKHNNCACHRAPRWKRLSRRKIRSSPVGIAIAYGTTIKQIQQLNRLMDTTVQTGQFVDFAERDPARSQFCPAGSCFSDPSLVHADDDFHRHAHT